MRRGVLIDRLADHIAGLRRHPLGVAGFMIEDEIAQGRAVMQPGAVWPFVIPEEDWVAPIVVSHDGREVFIVAILAQSPGNGAFRRLIDNITDAQMRPVVVCPVGVQMPAILRKWGWRCKVRGRGIERVDEWRPQVARGRMRHLSPPSSEREGSREPLSTPKTGSAG